jgi:hypothetical protein
MTLIDPAVFGNGAFGCYKPTVNESETINEAKPVCLVCRRDAGSGLPAGPPLERS